MAIFCKQACHCTKEKIPGDVQIGRRILGPRVGEGAYGVGTARIQLSDCCAEVREVFLERACFLEERIEPHKTHATGGENELVRTEMAMNQARLMKAAQAANPTLKEAR